MCGITGYINNKNLDPTVLQMMVDALYHRGPDSSGFYNSSYYCAGMRRLSINDLTTGDQPLYNEDRSVVLLYNGEIYNSPKLRQKLEDKGHIFKTTSDGEVICHLYEEYQEHFVEEIDGMFALALWVENDRKLILARDFPGEKPLYYAKLSDTEIAFSSEIKSLKLFPNLNLTLDIQSLWDYPTFLWIPEPDTVFKEIKTLLPGHMLIADPYGIVVKRYYDKQHMYDLCQDDTQAVTKLIRDTVEQAVSSRLLSDVPLGAFLSGGLDSSIVAALTTRRVSNLTTFTIGFENLNDPYSDKVDESLYAEKFAKQLGTTHHTIRVTASTFKKNLRAFCASADQPFGVSSGLGIFSIAEAAHSIGIKVLLSGDGADECFGGYPWYQHLNGDCPVTKPFINDQQVSFQSFGLPLAERLRVISSYSAQHRAWAWHYYASEADKHMLFSPEVSIAAKNSLRFFDNYSSKDVWSPEDYIRHDRQFYFPYEMLRKVDRMTMAHSVEGRVPFAAPAIQELAEQLSYSHMVKGDCLKWSLKEAFNDLLPNDILARPKHGFNVPIDHWLKHEWHDLVERTFGTDSALMHHGLITEDSIGNAQKLLHDRVRINGHTIFCFITLNMWLEQNI